MSEEAVSVFRDTHGRIAVEWEVKTFFDLPQNHGERILSPTFVLSSARWCLWMCPEGAASEASRGFISLFLKREDETTDEHHLSYTMGIKKLDGSAFQSFDLTYKFKEGLNAAGRRTFLKKSDLSASENVVTPDGSVTFFCVARILDLDDRTKATASQTSPEGIDPLISQFKDSYIKSRFCDVKIKVGDREFQAHRMVLAARSPVFRAMFELEMAESSSGVVNIVDSDPESFEDFLLFLYTGTLDSVPSSNIMCLFKTADKYNMKELKDECSRRLNNELSVDLVCDVVGLAGLYNDAELLDTATQFFINNAHKILSTAKWLQFLASNISLANELLLKLALHKVEPEITE